MNKVFNKAQTERTYQIEVAGHPGLKLELPDNRLTVAPSHKLELPLNVQMDPAELGGATNIPITFKVTATDDEDVRAEAESRFMAPQVR